MFAVLLATLQNTENVANLLHPLGIRKLKVSASVGLCPLIPHQGPGAYWLFKLSLAN